MPPGSCQKLLVKYIIVLHLSNSRFCLVFVWFLGDSRGFVCVKVKLRGKACVEHMDFEPEHSKYLGPLTPGACIFLPLGFHLLWP